jgi:hypothetical protein
MKRQQPIQGRIFMADECEKVNACAFRIMHDFRLFLTKECRLKYANACTSEFRRTVTCSISRLKRGSEVAHMRFTRHTTNPST